VSTALLQERLEEKAGALAALREHVRRLERARMRGADLAAASGGKVVSIERGELTALRKDLEVRCCGRRGGVHRITWMPTLPHLRSEASYLASCIAAEML
jgi:hypothetical protein